MTVTQIVNKANDIINSNEEIKLFYPNISKIIVEPLDSVTVVYEDKLKYNLGYCKFNIYLTSNMVEFSKKLISDVKSRVYNPNSIYSPLNDYLFYNYQIDTAYLISQYVRDALKKEDMFFDSWKYEEDIYSLDGRNITVLERVFKK